MIARHRIVSSELSKKLGREVRRQELQTSYLAFYRVVKKLSSKHSNQAQ
jgi:hypothetical protein